MTNLSVLLVFAAVVGGFFGVIAAVDVITGARFQRALAVARRAWSNATPAEDPHPIEWDDEQRAARAAAAQRLLTDPLLSEAFASLERTYQAAWLATTAAMAAERERLWDAASVLRSVRQHLEEVAREGVLMESRLSALTQRRSATAARPPRERTPS